MVTTQPKYRFQSFYINVERSKLHRDSDGFFDSVDLISSG